MTKRIVFVVVFLANFGMSAVFYVEAQNAQARVEVVLEQSQRAVNTAKEAVAVANVANDVAERCLAMRNLW